MAEQEKVRNLFNTIAGKYDFLNHLLSFRIDKLWRKKAIRSLEAANKDLMLDVACGTADFAIAAAKSGVEQIVGVDISDEMMKIGREKIERAGLSGRIRLQSGACESLDFPAHTFSAAGIAFGIRNFENREESLQQLFRVLKPGGQLVILEFSLPGRFPLKQLYLFYFNRLLPFIGGLVSGNRAAYRYLPRSVQDFPLPETFSRMIGSAGFSDCRFRRLSGGIAVLYTACKPKD